MSQKHILIGLGGTGGLILREFKKRMVEKFPSHEERRQQQISIIYVDTSSEMMSHAENHYPGFRLMSQDVSFTANECIHIGKFNLQEVLSHVECYPSVREFVHDADAVKNAVGCYRDNSCPTRLAARIFFAINSVEFQHVLQFEMQDVWNCSFYGNPVVHIFAGLGESAGSGTIIDAIVQTRNILPNARIFVYAVLPNAKSSDLQHPQTYSNAYAAIKELNALQTGRWLPSDITIHDRSKIYSNIKHGVADAINVICDSSEESNNIRYVPKLISDFVFSLIHDIYKQNDNYNNQSFLRNFYFECMCEFCDELDETSPETNWEIPLARTKKVSTFGITRIIYPEQKVFLHSAYTICQNILMQFKFNNWIEHKGYANEKIARDNPDMYLSNENLFKWKVDIEHLTYNLSILPNDKAYPSFSEEWHEVAVILCEMVTATSDSINYISGEMEQYFMQGFRNKGVSAYFQSKEANACHTAEYICNNIKQELLNLWEKGEISIESINVAFNLLHEKLTSTERYIEESLRNEQIRLDEVRTQLAEMTAKWNRFSIVKRKISGNQYCRNYIDVAENFYTLKTRISALNAAKKLCNSIIALLGNITSRIQTFANTIEDSISDIEKQKNSLSFCFNNLTDIKGDRTEIAKESNITYFENSITLNKEAMDSISREIRAAILNKSDYFEKYHHLSSSEITEIFELRVAGFVRTQHADLIRHSTKPVLDVNILSILKEKLNTEEDYRAFALAVIENSKSNVGIDKDEIMLEVPNNSDFLSPKHPSSIDRQIALLSLPCTEGDPELNTIVDKLESAFNSVYYSNIRPDRIKHLIINRESGLKNEINFVNVRHLFPFRAIENLKIYKEYYTKFLNTGIEEIDRKNALSIHPEANGHNLPLLFPDKNQFTHPHKIQNEIDYPQPPCMPPMD